MAANLKPLNPEARLPAGFAIGENMIGRDINWYTEAAEISGDPFKGYLEIRAGRVYLVREMLPVSDHTDATHRRPDIGLNIDRRARGAES
jgi:hypothetical protein